MRRRSCERWPPSRWHVGATQAASETALAAAEQAASAPSSPRAALPGPRSPSSSATRWCGRRGFGVANVETGAPVTPDTLFQIGSATKTFTAAALLSAAPQGAVALDRPVSTYVSGLAACVGAPTLTQLLSHTGGVMDEPDEFGPQGEEGLAAYARTWTSEYCLLPPGRAFSYSNSGFALAGLALQEAEKKPFAEVMRARVLDPLGMPRTTFRPTEAMTWPLAVGHRRDKEGKFTVVRPLANDARLWPAGTLYSSANEMARLARRAAQRRTRGRGSRRFRRASSRRCAPSGRRHPDDQPALRPGPVPDRLVGLRARRHDDRLRGVGHDSSRSEAGRRGVDQRRQRQPDADRAWRCGPPLGQPLRQVPTRRFRVAACRRRPAMPTSAPSAIRAASPWRSCAQGDGLVLKRFGRDFPMRFVYPRALPVDLPRGGTETIAFGLGADGRADYLQMNVWALARVTP